MTAQADGYNTRGSSGIRPAGTGHSSMVAMLARKIPGRRPRQHVHRLAMRAWGYELQQQQTLEHGLPVSHLCHHSQCFSLTYLVLESNQANLDRRRCVRYSMGDVDVKSDLYVFF